MAIVGGQDDEEAKAQKAGTGEGSFIGGGSGQGATTKTGAATPTSSGSYTNLSSYLQANQGSGGTTGKAAENVVDQAGGVAKTAQGQFDHDASRDITAATVGAGPTQDSLNKIKAGGNVVTGAYDGPDPASLAVSYGGPTDIGHFTGKAASSQAAAQGANADVFAKTAAAQGGQAGVSSLLRTAYQQPSYTAGENNLDSFLARGTPGGQQALNRAPEVAKNTAGAYAGINDLLSGKIATGKATADATNQSYKDFAAETGRSAAQAKSDREAAQAKLDAAAKAEADRKAAAEAQALADKVAADEEAARVAAQKQAEADAVKASTQKLIEEIAAANASNNPVVTDSPQGDDPGAAAGSPAYEKLKELFPAPQKSVDNPLIPNPIPNPVPVIPPMPEPAPIVSPLPSVPVPAPALPNPIPSLNPFPFLKKKPSWL